MDELINRLRDFAVELRKAEDALLVRDAADAIEERCQQVDKFAEEAARLYAKQPKWIPVTERLPEVNKYVLGYFKDGSMTAVCLFDIDEHMTFWRACTDEGWEADCDSEPTHWMPLPEPPKEE